MADKKILQVCNTDFYLSKFLKPLILSLVEEGYDVHIATEGRGIPAEIASTCQIHQVEFPKKPSPGSFWKSIQSLRTIIRDHDFFCVNSHNRNASIVARIAAWLEHTPVNLYTAHGFYFHDDQSGPARFLTIAFEAMLARITDYTLSQSQEDTDLMTKYRMINCSKIKTIGNGIDTRKFSVKKSRDELERRLSLNSGAFRIACIGRIVAGKGFLDILQAFIKFISRGPAYKNSELLIIGGNIDADISPILKRVRKMIEEHNISSRVTITGIVENVEDYLHASDIFVSASYREGISRAVLEAMCSGLPVVVTNIRGSREVVLDGVHGIVFDPKDICACEEAMVRLYENLDMRNRLGNSGRELVLGKYAQDAYVKRQLEVINKLCKI